MTGIFDRITSKSDEHEVSNHAVPDNNEDALLPEVVTTIDDDARTPSRLREAVQELLKHGLLEESLKPNLYRIIVNHTAEISAILEPLDLAPGVDDVRGLVYLRVRTGELAEQDDWVHPLVRRQRFNLEQSLLVAILRQYFIAYEQESGTGASEALVAVDELIPQLQVYLGDLNSDARERTRATQLLDQLKGHGLVSSLDEHQRVTIRPIIAHLANPENLQALLVWMRAQLVSAEQDQVSSDQEDDE